MTKIIQTVIVIALALAAAFAGYRYQHSFDAPVVVAEVFIPEATLIQNRLIVTDGDRLVVVSCTREQLTQSRFSAGQCLSDVQYVGDGYALVKNVTPEYKARVQAAMTKSIVYTGLDIVDGHVLE